MAKPTSGKSIAVTVVVAAVTVLVMQRAGVLGAK